jgi:serine protease Do
MADKIPYINPTSLLKFFSHFVSRQLKIGEVVFPVYGSLSDYLLTVPENYRSDPRYSMDYHNELLKMAQLLVNEGLLSPMGSEIGLAQKFRCNGFRHGDLIDYGYYDFMIYGFPAIRENFVDAVRQVILTNSKGDKDIGTGFLTRYGNKLYFVTAKHCLPKEHSILIPAPDESGFKQPMLPKHIYFPADEKIDLAIIEIVNNNYIQVSDAETKIAKGISFSDKYFLLGKPNILDQVLTMGFPPIQGFIDAIQVSETATIASGLKSTTGEITGQGLHYPGGCKEHFLISARVKGGNSGGPVINRFGLVVGMIIELLQNADTLDLLGYGVAVSSTVIEDLITSIENNENKIGFKNVSFAVDENVFALKE